MPDPGVDPRRSAECSRRDLLIRGAQVTAGASALAALLAACGGGDGAATTAPTTEAAATTAAETAAASTPSGPVRILTYGNDAVTPLISTAFESAASIAVEISEAPEEYDSVQVAESVIAAPDQYDLVWTRQAGLTTLRDAGVLADADATSIPNLGLVAEPFRSAFAGAVPTDWGSLGFAYRPDMVAEQPTSWSDFWTLAQTAYSGKAAAIDDFRMIYAALIKDGADTTTADQARIKAARDTALELKPHLLRGAYSTPMVGNPLVDGTAALVIDYADTIGWARFNNPDIEITWVAPDEGLPAYLAGFAALQGPGLAGAQRFLDFLLDPPNYAKSIDAVPAGWVMPEVNDLIAGSFRGSPLDWDEAVFARMQFPGADLAQNALVDAAWAEVVAG